MQKKLIILQNWMQVVLGSTTSRSSFEDFMDMLPGLLSIFRVKATVLMPKAQLPIIVSDVEYPSVATELIVGNVVGIIQPAPSNRGTSSSDSMYKSGCAGRVTDMSQIDNDVMVNIFGLCRFDVVNYTNLSDGLEKAIVSYDKYISDLDECNIDSANKERLFSALDAYFKAFNISPNWKEIEKAPDDVLVSALAMACPFHPSEKQSLLETASISEMSQMMAKMIEIESFNLNNISKTLN